MIANVNQQCTSGLTVQWDNDLGQLNESSDAVYDMMASSNQLCTSVLKVQPDSA